MVLVDDTWATGGSDEAGEASEAGFGGKGARSVPFLLQRDFRLEWCEERQALLCRRST